MNPSDDPVLRAFSRRSIGPFGQGGRVDDLAVHPENTHTYLVGFVTGGLWKATNNRTTFRSGDRFKCRGGPSLPPSGYLTVVCDSPQFVLQLKLDDRK